MATFTKKRWLSREKWAMVTPMHFMTVQAIFCNRWMFKSKWPSLFSMTFEAKLVY
jgi:hypothetical protein